ncbi:MAG: 50S ribosomal protein L24 [Armatimonadota bacterium]|nr:50S ribosomal protein L24 [Armatimonadota bacterium]MDR7452635.1 50S ribosomal protein L24 [Armatimonadota bacterium]MDR7468180.1 50S ribosomal protein L24 [Armatimonadota bacterium]MDR7495174.1 50S ribosomal protein L24 [Armatimonadota bacterium]MDR7499308.1 50S ribosomal protein L24 [Armatimonadota bacterium]
MAVVAGRQPVHVRKGDTVEVIGGKHRGKRGKVLKVLTKDGTVIVEGVNLVKRHTKPTQKLPQGGIVEKEAPLHASRVMLVCPKCGKAARMAHGYLADGTKIRVCKHCGEQVEK